MKRTVALGIISASIAITSMLVFYGIPNAVEKLAFSGKLLFSGGVHRFFTFPFVHVNSSHLFQNMIALGVAFLLTMEIELLRSHYLISFFGSSAMIALANLVAFPAVLIAGASVGVYAVFGAIAARGSNFIPRKSLIILLSVPVLGHVVYSAASSGAIMQAVLHGAGFFIGLVALLITKRIQEPARKRILEMTI